MTTCGGAEMPDEPSQSAEMELSEDAAGVRDLLNRYFDDRPLNAAEIAGALGLYVEQNRERQRRSVRDVVKELREAGYAVCANDRGYWLARNAVEYPEYLDARKRRVTFDFVEQRKMREAVTDRACGQQRLFQPAPAECFRR